MRRKGTEMYCFTCKEDFESMMTCIYRVWEAKKGSQNVRLEIEPVEQMDLLTEYVHVEVDPELAHKVVRSIRTKISAKAYYQVYLAAMSNDPGRLDDIYRFLRIGFAVGGKVTECLREESVMQIFELSRRTPRSPARCGPRRGRRRSGSAFSRIFTVYENRTGDLCRAYGAKGKCGGTGSRTFRRPDAIGRLDDH